MEKIAKINQVPIKIFLFLIANDLIDTAGQLLIKKGLGAAGSQPHYFFVGLGLVIFVSNFFLWMKILSAIDLSVALPMASSSYIIVPIAAIIFLHEHIPPLRWFALFLIVIGIYFISKSKSKEKTSL